MTIDKYPQIDIAALKLEVDKQAQLLLNEVTEENLAYFSSQIKKIAEGILEDYMNGVFDLYMEGARKISDLSLSEKFSDYKTGYEAQMRQWIKEHPIEVQQVEIQIPEVPQAPGKPISPKAVFICGTAIAVGLFIFSPMWVALCAELLTLALTYLQKKCIDSAQSDYQTSLNKYDLEIQSYKRKLVKGLTDDLSKWLELGKSNSDSILASYDL